jgi:hypothetical protein
MKKRFGLLAILCLLCGLAAGGFAGWRYYYAQAQFGLIRDLHQKSFELEEQSDTVKGTPEENRLMDESHEYDLEASLVLSTAKRNSQLALISGIISIFLILLSVVMIILNLRKKEVELE